MSQGKAAEALAAWAIASPSRRPGGKEDAVRVVSLYHHHDGRDSVGVRLRIRGDGVKANLLKPGTGDSHQVVAEYDLKGLRAVMLDLITVPLR